MQFLLRDYALNETDLRASSYPLYSLALTVKALKVYGIPVLVAIGTLGNLLNVIVFSQSKLRKSSGTPYLQALCVTDTLFLIMVVILWLDVFDLEPLAIGFSCQAVTMVTSVCAFIAVWMSVGLCINRCVSLDFPTLRERCNTTLCSKFIVLAISCSAVVLYVNLSLLHASFIMPASESLCIPLPDYFDVIVLWNKIDAALNFILPYTVMMVLVIVIARHLRYMCIRRHFLISTRDRRRMSAVFTVRYSSRLEVHVTKMGLVITASFLSLNLPGHILRLIVMFASDNHDHTFLLQQLFLYLYFARAALNFLPFWIVCKPYREYVHSSFGMFFERCRCRKPSVVGTRRTVEIEADRKCHTPTYRV